MGAPLSVYQPDKSVRKPPPPPATCEHDGLDVLRTCACVCRKCWDSTKPILQRCKCEACTTHCPKVKIVNR